MRKLCDDKLARGNLTFEQRLDLIHLTYSLAECIHGAAHIQECINDDLLEKQQLFAKIDSILDEEFDDEQQLPLDVEGQNRQVPICSSSSVHLPNLLFQLVVKHKSQCLVAHPINPLVHVRLVELIPSIDTREEILIKVRLTMDEIEQKPVVLRKEVPGFALNRFQYAVFQEAFRMVHDGVMTPDDVDTVISDGLGPKYAFMGPWMTAHLNAEGLTDYLTRFHREIYNVTKSCMPLLEMDGEAAQQIIDSVIHRAPIDELDDKRAWRDKCIIELARVKDRMGKY